MWINDAYAAAEPVLGNGTAVSGTFVQLVLILLIFYFLLIRPQQKRMKEHAAMVEALKVGDDVVTNSGIYGTVSKLDEKSVWLEVSANTVVRFDRMAVSTVVEKQPKKATAPKSVAVKDKKKK